MRPASLPASLHRLRHRRFAFPKEGYVARRSRRQPVPSGGWLGANTFPSGLAVPRSINPWGPCASSGSVPAEAFVVPSTLSRTDRPTDCVPLASLPEATRPSEDFRALLVSNPRSFRHRVDSFLRFLPRSSLAAFPVSVPISGLDNLKLRLDAESHKLCKPDLSTFCRFGGG
jgi:hypothetical protein